MLYNKPVDTEYGEFMIHLTEKAQCFIERKDVHNFWMYLFLQSGLFLYHVPRCDLNLPIWACSWWLTIERKDVHNLRMYLLLRGGLFLDHVPRRDLNLPIWACSWWLLRHTGDWSRTLLPTSKNPLPSNDPEGDVIGEELGKWECGQEMEKKDVILSNVNPQTDDSIAKLLVLSLLASLVSTQ